MRQILLPAANIFTLSFAKRVRDLKKSEISEIQAIIISKLEISGSKGRAVEPP